jgi:hypothetical protein
MIHVGGEDGFATRVGVLVAVAEALAARDLAASRRTRRVAVAVAADLAALYAVFERAQVRFAAIGRVLIAVREA